jgi:peptidoglycan hydrolase-like protein with peptidoglycan-binding domain
MRRVAWSFVWILAGCHAHTAQSPQASMEKPPTQPQVSSPRPVRTTPGGVLDPLAMKQIQAALNHHGVKAPSSGELDSETKSAIRQFQTKHKMASTGVPDYETLRKLGLDPKQIYVGGAQRALRKGQ